MSDELMKKYYLVNCNQAIEIVCYNESYLERIKRIWGFSSYSEQNIIIASIILEDDRTIIKSNLDEHILPHLELTDIYPLFYSVIYNCFNKDNKIMIHSCIVSRDNSNDGLMLLGDFGSGKTTLMQEFIENGWHANSADQSLVEIKKNTLFLCKGSRFYRNNENDIDYLHSITNVNIKKIIIINGMCDNGHFNCQSISRYECKIRKLWIHMSSPWLTPLIGTSKSLQINSSQAKYIYDNCVKFSGIFNEIYLIRGNKNNCFKNIVKMFEMNN